MLRSIYLPVPTHRLEEVRRLHVHPHSPKDDTEVVALRLLLPPEHKVLLVAVRLGLLHQPSLSADLGGDLIVGQAGGGEEGDLLAARDRVHHVDRGDARADHLLGVSPL